MAQGYGRDISQGTYVGHNEHRESSALSRFPNGVPLLRPLLAGT